jgi:hypothetical protein
MCEASAWLTHAHPHRDAEIMRQKQLLKQGGGDGGS